MSFCNNVLSEIRNLRKEADLEVTDRIEVALDGVTEQLRHAVETHRGYISAEVLAASLTLTPVQESHSNGVADTLEVDGESTRIFVRKA